MTFSPDVPRNDDWEGVKASGGSFEDKIIDEDALNPADALMAKEDEENDLKELSQIIDKKKLSL